MSLMRGRVGPRRVWRFRDWVRISIVLLAMTGGIAGILWGLLWALGWVAMRP